MNQIIIEETADLQELEAKMNRKTWESIKSKKGNSVFFPSANPILMVSESFELQVVLHIVDEDIDDNTMLVSPDVKKNRYPDKNSITY